MNDVAMLQNKVAQLTTLVAEIAQEKSDLKNQIINMQHQMNIAVQRHAVDVNKVREGIGKHVNNRKIARELCAIFDEGFGATPLVEHESEQAYAVDANAVAQDRLG